MEVAELELERRSRFLNSLIEKKKSKEQQEQYDRLNVSVRASDMPIPLQTRAFKCAREQLNSMPGKLHRKRLALALKKEFDSAYGPAWHCIVGASFGSYVTHSVGGFLYFSIDKLEDMEISHFEEHKKDEALGVSMQTLPIWPSLDSRPNSSNPQAEPGPPHEALFFVLAYLPVYELINMSEVCMSFRDAVNKDVLPWLDIIIDRPLSSRLSNEILWEITTKANGRLRALVLRNSKKITNDGLQRVAEKNPFITKLHLPACTGLTPEGIIRAVNTLSHHQNNLKSLQINGIYNIKKEHVETIFSHLKMNPLQQKLPPILYHHYRSSSSRSTESDRIIDVGICPKCNEVRMVFDCPRETCRRMRGQLFEICRGCNFCIPRCEECGGCVCAEELEEAACPDILCSNCWLNLPKCNYCNKPYCKQHSNQQFSSPGCSGFICEACHMTPLVDS